MHLDGLGGFPVGYNGKLPMLSVGHLSGMDTFDQPDGTQRTRWVINAAFNSGNSGGPLLNAKDGKVIGVVASKLAPMPQVIADALNYLETEKRGPRISHKLADGSRVHFSQGQLISMVLDYLKSQVQLVIGHAVRLGDLKKFLKANGLEP